MKSFDDRRSPRRLITMSLVTKIGLLLFMTFIVVLGATGIFWWYLEDTSDDLRVVQTLSQQRILSMQIVSLAEDVDGRNPEARRQLRATAQNFDDRLPRIVERTDNLAEVPSNITMGYPPVTESWQRLHRHIQIVVDPDASADARDVARDYILDHGPQLTETFEEANTAYRNRADHLRGLMGGIIIGAIILNVALLFTGTLWTRRRIVTPLRRLERATENIRRGELTSRVGSHTGDELGTLEAAFNEMADEIEDLVAALDEERHFAQSLVAHAPAGVVVHRHEQILFANPEFCRLLGIESLDELPDRDLSKLFQNSDRELARNLITDLDPSDAEQAPAPKELHLLEDDGGQPRTVEVVSVPLDYGAKKAVLTVMHDTTEKKKLTAQMMQMDRVIAIGTLVAGVGHEINNPLSFVSGNIDYTIAELETLQSQIDDGDHSTISTRQKLDDLQTALRSASEGATRIADIVTQLRRFSRRDDAPREPIDIREPIESAINMANGQIRHRAHLTRRFDDVPPVEANESQLAQIVLNLLINAAHAIDEGDAEHQSIDIHVYSDDDHVIVEIRDTGNGIDADDAERIFDPFYTTKPPGQGTGLGLAICQQLVEAHDGMITFDTEPGVGTTFRVILPVSQEQPASENRDSAPDIATPGRTIAVVDDEPLVGEIFARNLDGTHTTKLWTDSTAFLDALDSGQHFDVIFCDLMMPNITGMELYDILAASHPDLVSRMVFITGGAFTPRARKFLETVDPPLLEKPFDLDQLHTLIDDIDSRA